MNRVLFTALLLFSFPAFAATNWEKFFYPTTNAGLVFSTRFEGSLPFDKNVDLAVKPASNSKLFTSTIALELLGPDFRYETRVSWSVLSPGVISDLTLIGSGDPSWGMMEFGEDASTRLGILVEELRSRGVKEVRGPISFLSNDSRWDLREIPPGWQSNDLPECYGALPEAFNLGLNCELFTVTDLTSGHWSDSLITTPVHVSLRLGTRSAATVSVAEDGFSVTGSLISGQTAVVGIPVRGVTGWMAGILKRELRTHSILVNEAALSSTPTSVTGAFSLFSPPLREVLKPFLKQSLNLVGEALLRTMGERFGVNGQNLNEAGTEVLRSGIDALVPGNALVLHDGSGLSRLSSVTASSLHSFLKVLLREFHFQDIWEALPIAGVDGTLKNRMKNTTAAGLLRAKTGTLNGVANLSGFIPLKANSSLPEDLIPFVILGTDTSGPVASVRAAQDRVGAELVRVNLKRAPVRRSLISPFMNIRSPFQSEKVRDPRLKVSVEDAF